MWVSNQLAADKLDKSAAFKVGHSDAGEAKGWGQSLDFHFGLGNLNHEFKVTQIHASKTRRTGDAGRSTLIRLNGGYARWESADDKFTVYNGDVAPRDVVESYGGEAAPKPRASRTSGSFLGE